MAISIYTTKDQSHTIYTDELDETYHSSNGAIKESEYVYIEKGLHEAAKNKTSLHILEIGFGTGLNALLTLYEAEKGKLQVHYDSLEAYPLPLETALQLNYHTLVSTNTNNYFSQLHKVEWDKPQAITSQFTLHKIHQTLADFEPDQRYDLIYFDAFGPEKQPDMWTMAHFTKLYLCLNAGGILVTYSSKGEVRRILKQIGFEVQRLPGPPMKRHMIRGIKHA